MHALPGYLTSEEAAAALGVRRATLYSYVSRGLIRIAATRQGRRRLYLEADVERLRRRAAAARGHGPAAAAALDWGMPVLASAITSIDPDGPNYRGEPAVSLAEAHHPFEAIVHLLWSGELRSDPPPLVVDDLGVDPDLLERALPPGLHPHTALAALIPLLAAADPLRHAIAADEALPQARRLIRRMAAGLAYSGPRAGWRERLRAALEATSIADAILAALGASSKPDPGSDLHQVLILCADHELNASSFAARIAAGAGADLYAVLSAALATLSGPRHGGLSDRVEDVLDEAQGAADVARWIAGRSGRGEEVPGFGHRLYPEGDPRAAALIALARRRPTGARGKTLLALIEAMAGAGHPAPNLDVGLVAACHAVGLPRGSASAVFAIGRAAGWVAHAREQHASGQLLRPRARYVGP